MILCAGNINYDILMRVDRYPQPHEKLVCREAVMGCGGSAANTAHWLARLGVPTAMAGKVGDDAAGREQLAALQQVGVDVSRISTVPATTGVAVIFSAGEDKRMLKAPGANTAAGAFLPEDIPGTSAVYLSGDDRKYLARVAAAAGRSGAHVVLGGPTAGDEDLLKLADGVILNHDELAAVTGLEEPAEGLRAVDLQQAAVTLPGGGCLVSRGIEVEEVPAPVLAPVDRTGGGDAFAAAFLAARHLGMSTAVAGQWGNLLAAAVIMQPGARPPLEIPHNLQI